MKLYLKAFGVTLVVGIIFVLLFWQWSRSTLPTATHSINLMDQMENEGLPEFEIKDLDGKPVHLGDFKGRPVIVSFWASWCGPCLDEFPSMIELIEKMDGKVQLVAISQDSNRTELEAFLKAFPKSKHPNISILWDQEMAVGRQYNVDRLPESYVTGKDHKLVRKIVGSINWSTPEAVEFMQGLVDK
jgi:cytochrome c biogenesis protein CcmG, thiol:disulfide interchange protein DsbE